MATRNEKNGVTYRVHLETVKADCFLLHDPARGVPRSRRDDPSFPVARELQVLNALKATVTVNLKMRRALAERMDGAATVVGKKEPANVRSRLGFP